MNPDDPSLAQPPAPLPYPVYFVYPRLNQWADVLGEAHPRIDEHPHRFRECNDCWVMLTYLHLRRRGLDVRISDRMVPGQICVASYHDLRIKDFPFGSYVAACRHDCARPEICQHTIVQNESNVQRPTDHFVHHWPQPGLIARDVRRGTRVETMAYKGWENNLYKAFRSTEFGDRLANLGVAFRLDGKPPAGTELRWHDYRDVDVVLAVRDLTEQDYLIKPASKLVNAWLAGVPALLGPEPAYRALRRSPLDYIEVRTPDEALAAVSRLKGDAALYTAMVANGLTRAREVEAAATARRWRDILAGPVAEGYARWRGQTMPVRAIVRPARFLGQSIRHKKSWRRYLEDRVHGYRPISGRTT